MELYKLTFPHYFWVEDFKIIPYFSLIFLIIIIAYRLNYLKRSLNISLNELFRSINLRAFVKYWLLQRRVLRTPRGVIHTFLFYGTLLLALGTLIRFLDYYIYHFMYGELYILFRITMTLGGLFLVVSSLLFIIIRLILKPVELTYGVVDWLFPICLLYIAVSGFFMSGIVSLAIGRPWIADPLGLTLINILGLNELPMDLLNTIYRIVWLTHAFTAFFTIALFPFTKVGHVFFSAINLLFQRGDVNEVSTPIFNVKDIIEKGGQIGAGNIRSLEWKEKLNLLSCTYCGRCENVCPAYRSSKPLNPAKLIQGLNTLAVRGQVTTNISQIASSLNVWTCTTCGACVFECPVLINHTKIIIDLKRYMLSANENVPDKVLSVINNVARSGNTYNLSIFDRNSWLDDVLSKFGLEYANEDEEYDYIIWLGCAINYEPSQRQKVFDLVKILKKAGVKFAFLPEEICCGEPLRRLGEEYLYQEHMMRVVDLLRKYKFKYLVVLCPHGYYNFRFEYSRFGHVINVKHHVQVIYELLRSGKIRIKSNIEDRVVTYHDPCYLARWSGIVKEPREIMRPIVNKYVELKNSRERTFCCGGGSGQYFYQIGVGERISKLRARQIAESKADMVVVACPFCFGMLKDEVENMGIGIVDIATLVAENLE